MYLFRTRLLHETSIDFRWYQALRHFGALGRYPTVTAEFLRIAEDGATAHFRIEGRIIWNTEVPGHCTPDSKAQDF